MKKNFKLLSKLFVRKVIEIDFQSTQLMIIDFLQSAKKRKAFNSGPKDKQNSKEVKSLVKKLFHSFMIKKYK